MIKPNVRRSLVMLAVMPLAATGMFLTAPAASAGVWETSSHSCDTSAKGHDLDIKVKVWHNEDGDVESTTVRATDRRETGKFKERHVLVKKVVVEYLDDDGKVVGGDDDFDSPWTTDDDGTDVDDVKVTVTWKIHDSFKTKTCTVKNID